MMFNKTTVPLPLRVELVAQIDVNARVVFGGGLGKSTASRRATTAARVRIVLEVVVLGRVEVAGGIVAIGEARIEASLLHHSSLACDSSC